MIRKAIKTFFKITCERLLHNTTTSTTFKKKQTSAKKMENANEGEVESGVEFESALADHMMMMSAVGKNQGHLMNNDCGNDKNKKVALITGISGQDGSYLAELLLEKGYQVHGIIRRSSSFNTGRIEHLYKNPYTHTEGSVAKQYAYWIVVNYREAYKMFVSNGILFNHESPRRGATFVTRKITRAVAKIHLGLLDFFELGNLNSKRDWGHAKEYVEAMWLILQHDSPDDFVIATGECHSVREFVEAAFNHIGITIRWEGAEINEIGKDKATGVVRVKVNPKYYRPTEVDLLIGDPTKAGKLLDWKPKTKFTDLVAEMVDADIELMKTNPSA